MTHVRSGHVGVWVAVIAFLLGGCSRQPTSSVSPSQAPTSSAIKLQLNWLPDAQHGGFYAAVEEQHFAAAGLDVEIMLGGPGTAAIPKVATGRCDFAIGNADQVLLARQQGADVVAIFAAMQNSPRCIMVHEKSGIESLQQIKNVTLALGDGKAFAEFLKRHVSLDDVRIVSYSGTVAKFLLDDNFCQQAYVFSEPILAASKGGDPKPLMVSDVGFNPYSSLLVTRRELVEERPEFVQNVVRAVRAGWKSYLADPTKTNKTIVAANPEMDIALLDQSAIAIQPLCRPKGFRGRLGSMDPKRWELLRQQLIELELLPATTGDAGTAFTNDF